MLEKYFVNFLQKKVTERVLLSVVKKLTLIEELGLVLLLHYLKFSLDSVTYDQFIVHFAKKAAE